MIVSGHQRTGPKKLFRWRNPKRFFSRKKDFRNLIRGPEFRPISQRSLGSIKIRRNHHFLIQNNKFLKELDFFCNCRWLLKFGTRCECMHAFHSGSASDTLPLSASFSLSPSPSLSFFLSLSLSHSLSHPSLIPQDSNSHLLSLQSLTLYLTCEVPSLPHTPWILCLSLFLSHQSSICLLELSPSNILILSSRFQTQKQFFPFSNSFSSFSPFSPSHSNFCPERLFLHSFKVSLSQSKPFSAEIFLCMIPTEALLAQFLIFLARASVQQVQHGLGPIRRKPRSVQLPRLHSARRHPGD